LGFPAFDQDEIVDLSDLVRCRFFHPEIPFRFGDLHSCTFVGRDLGELGLALFDGASDSINDLSVVRCGRQDLSDYATGIGGLLVHFVSSKHGV